MSRRSLLVTWICTLAIACVMAETQLGFGGTGTGAGAGTGSAGPGGVSATRVAGFSSQNGRVKKPNGGKRPNHAVPVVAEVGSLSPGGGYGEGAAKIYGTSGSGYGTTGAAKLNANVVEARTGQGSGSSLGK